MMNCSYLMGVKDVTKLKDNGFLIQEIDGDFGISFSKDKEKFYEDFVIENLEEGYWNEYLGERFVFIFKFPDGTVKRFVHDKNNEEEIFKLCCKFAEYEFTSFIDMLKDNEFYAENYFNKKVQFGD